MRGYGDLLKEQTSTNPEMVRLSSLLDGFRASRDRHRQIEAEESRHALPSLKNLLAGYLESRARWADKQKAFADDFNLLEVMGIENLERFHSKILAWLLDRRIEHGTHAQGNLGFRLFLKELGKDLAVESNPQIITYPDEQYWVRCEASGDESRIDIEIAASGKFVIHIENKIQAPEGPKQIPRESRDLNERRKDLGVPKENSHAIFLTLDGTAPEDKRFRRFRPVRWGRIAHVFENFEKEAQPNEVKLFARHYAKAVRKLSAAEPIEKEPQYGEANV